MLFVKIFFFFIASSYALTIKDSFWEENCSVHWLPTKNNVCPQFMWNETCTPWNTSKCSYELHHMDKCKIFDCQVDI